MKKYLKQVIITFLVLSLLFTFQMVFAATPAQPGTEYDPLVTKSYVDNQIQIVTQKIGSSSGSTTVVSGTVDSQVINNLKSDISELLVLLIKANSEISDLKKVNQELTDKVNQMEQGFDVLNLKKGQRLFAGAGCEVILRAGEATVIEGQGGGMADVTIGIDLKNGNNVPANHQLISFRDDGRGLKFETDVWVTVKGTYSVE